MNVLLFGATGMIGQGVLRECVRAPDVTRVLAVGRSPSGQQHERVSDLVVPNLMDLDARGADLAGFDACFYSLGVSAVGMTEAQYTKVTYDLTLAAARTVLRVNPSLVFIYVAGQST